MAKKQESSLMRYWPVAGLLITFVGGYYTLQADASQNKKDIVRIDGKVAEQDKQTSDILVNQAKQQAVLENIYEAVKEIKSKK